MGHSRVYSLRKSRHILKTLYAWFRKKGKQLPVAEQQSLKTEMQQLDQALLSQQKELADPIAKRLESFSDTHVKKSFFDYASELFWALLFALVIATLVRQLWFEPYEIPTGSMRPTFKEQDHLTVTKTAFGINTPLETSHLYFDPNLVQRTSVVIFSGDGLPMNDVDTTYFGIFPYKKRYIKREIGKPGDTLYFYGGRIYGIDKEGKDIRELREAPWMQPLEHIPFITFEGVVSGSPGSILFSHMHKPAGRLLLSSGALQGEVYNGKKWVKDQPAAQKKPHKEIETYSDLMGMRNYAVARLLTKEELKLLGLDTEGLEEGVLYLQLHHTPSLSYPKPMLYREGAGSSIGIPGYDAIIPLKPEHLEALMQALYSSRFEIKDGKSKLYSLDEGRSSYDGPRFQGVPDGTYEFYFGKASSIHWGGIAKEVQPSNALYSRDPSNVQKLFNMGIEMSMAYAPSKAHATLFPHRYAYFREGDLYLMGAPIIKKDDPALAAFNKREQEKEAKSSDSQPYVAFKDYGPPVKDGQIDAEFIKTFGITIPDKQYLVLGDNHARSSDSRIFGFVPEENLQGAPYWIIWPPGERLGAPPQQPYPFMNIPRAIIWGIVALILLAWYAYYRWSIKQPIVKE